MSDLQDYIKKRRTSDPEFDANYDTGFAEFKIGAMLKIARKEAGLTQEQLAEKLHTKKTCILYRTGFHDDLYFLMRVMTPCNALT